MHRGTSQLYDKRLAVRDHDSRAATVFFTPIPRVLGRRIDYPCLPTGAPVCDSRSPIADRRNFICAARPRIGALSQQRYKFGGEAGSLPELNGANASRICRGDGPAARVDLVDRLGCDARLKAHIRRNHSVRPADTNSGCASVDAARIKPIAPSLLKQAAHVVSDRSHFETLSMHFDFHAWSLSECANSLSAPDKRVSA